MKKLFAITALLASSAFISCECEVVECVFHSDCPGGTCYSGSCTPPAETDTDTEGGSGGVTSNGSGTNQCLAYVFEAEARTITEWGCDPGPLPYPLDDATIIPQYMTTDYDTAQGLHQTAVCEGGCTVCSMEDTPVNWPQVAAGLTSSFYEQCLLELVGTPCDEPTFGLCDQAADLYLDTLTSPTNVPQMMRIQDAFVSGECEGTVLFVCEPSGADETGGSGGVEVTGTQWDLSQLICSGGDCTITTSLLDHLYQTSNQMEDDGLSLAPIYTHDSPPQLAWQLVVPRTTEWEESDTSKLLAVVGLEAGDTLTGISSASSPSNLGAPQPITTGAFASALMHTDVGNAHQVGVIKKSGRETLITLTVVP